VALEKEMNALQSSDVLKSFIFCLFASMQTS